MANAPSLELFILEGEQAGARAPLQLGSNVDISSKLDSDIVLRDPLVAGQQIRLSVSAESTKLEVLAGDVELMGQRIGAGESIELPPCMPLKIGDTTLAYGEANDPRWVDALRPDSDVAGDNLNNETVQRHMYADSPTTRPEHSPSPSAVHRNLTTWVVVGCLGLLGLVIGVGALNSASTPASLHQQSRVPEITAVLRNAGFSTLQIEESETGRFTIHGYLATQEQRVQLENLLTEWGIPAQIPVQVGEQLALAVRDVYRLNGIAAEVRPQGPGIVQVLTTEADLEQLRRVETIARRDVAGLLDMLIENRAPDARPVTTVPTDNNPGKRVASVVPGNPAYLVTTDGARYFVGAMLPTGHKISAISAQQVLLDWGGEVTALNF
jgi:type III secretion protein D